MCMQALLRVASQMLSLWNAQCAAISSANKQCFLCQWDCFFDHLSAPTTRCFVTQAALPGAVHCWCSWLEAVGSWLQGVALTVGKSRSKTVIAIFLVDFVQLSKPMHLSAICRHANCLVWKEPVPWMKHELLVKFVLFWHENITSLTRCQQKCCSWIVANVFCHQLANKSMSKTTTWWVCKCLAWCVHRHTMNDKFWLHLRIVVCCASSSEWV